TSAWRAVSLLRPSGMTHLGTTQTGTALLRTSTPTRLLASYMSVQLAAAGGHADAAPMSRSADSRPGARARPRLRRERGPRPRRVRRAGAPPDDRIAEGRLA